jgi:hypothetical protein
LKVGKLKVLTFNLLTFNLQPSSQLLDSPFKDEDFKAILAGIPISFALTWRYLDGVDTGTCRGLAFGVDCSGSSMVFSG